MVKAVQAEESISEYFDALLKNRVQAEVGLLVGKTSVGSRDIALSAIPTRTQDGEQALTVAAGSVAASKQKKSAGKPKSNEPTVDIKLDVENIAEHALDVSKMLPGGIVVLGVYLFAPDSGYSSASSDLCQTLATIAEDSSRLRLSSSSSSPAAPQELLLLHVDSSSRKFTMRSCQVSSAATAASTLKPCELKFGSALSSLVCLRCSHTLGVTLAASSTAVQMQQLLHDAVAAESARVAAAVAAIGGKIPQNLNQPLADVPASSTKCGAFDAVQVQLYCLPYASVAVPSGCSSSSAYGSSQLHGTVEAIAFVHKRDPVSKALQDLKNDVINSLKARVQLLDDEALAAAEEAKDAAAGAAAAAGGERSAAAAAAAAHPLLIGVGLGKQSKVGLARRVLLPWTALGLQVCCYLAEDESSDVAVEQAEQLMQLTGIQSSQVTEVEGPAVKQQRIVAGTAVKKTLQADGSRVTCSAAVVGAAAAAGAAALAAGLAYLNMG